jgi:hypothetical protein
MAAVLRGKGVKFPIDTANLLDIPNQIYITSLEPIIYIKGNNVLCQWVHLKFLHLACFGIKNVLYAFASFNILSNASIGSFEN